ncbi:hypothetical protein [Lysinibacillus sp. FSL W8-0992]|uniref:hypothetical protein n=1 Tax=Lysinibacillus sp. FSL W8-0992 TaxID=2954643 RepID=UPI0030F9129E
MKRKFPKDLSGSTFKRLTVIKLYDTVTSKNGNRSTRWLCKCSCGKEKVIFRTNLTSGQSTSCGCYQKEIVSTHNLTNHRLYSIWLEMKKRCFDKNRKSYKNYGGRGITICDEWKVFYNFYNWSINNGYLDSLTIDRIDNDGNYEPKNCRWTTRLVQNNNTRKNVFVDVGGERKTLSQLAREYDLSPNTIKYRMNNGYEDKELVAKQNTIKKEKVV